MARKVTKGKKWSPNPKQASLVNLLIETEEMLSIQKLCEVAGVTPKTYWEWRKKPEFIDYQNKRLEESAKCSKGSVWQALSKKAAAGDVQAIKLFFEMIGEYKDRKEVAGANGQAISFKWADDR